MKFETTDVTIVIVITITIIVPYMQSIHLLEKPQKLTS